MEADRAFALRYAKNREDFLKMREEEMREHQAPFDLTQAGIKSAFLNNKYLIVGGLWSSVVAGSLIYNFGRKDISTSQKLINARMTGQAAALLGVGAFGAASALGEQDQGIELDARFNDRLNKK